MSRPFSQRDYLSGRANTGNHLVPRERPFPEDASEMPGASSLDDQGQRYFADGEDWLADLPGGSEVMIPTWEAVPEGWFEVGGVSGLPAGRRLIGNRFSINYTLTDTLSWGIITPSNLYTDAARTTPVTTPPSPVGGADDASGNENHWAQDVSADRMIWETYTRDGETISGLRSDADNQHIDVPLSGAGAGSVLVFFRDSAFYAPADFGGADVALESDGLPIEEMLFLNRALTSTELAELIAAVRKERNRQPLDNWAAYGTTSLRYAFRGWSWLTEFPVIDLGGITNLRNAWEDCSSLTSFPLLDTSNVTGMAAAWQGCSSLTSFPLLDTSNVVNAEGAWLGCSSLTSFPLLDTSNVTSFDRTWQGCSSLTSFPELDTSNVTNVEGAWKNCSSLTSFPLLDLSNCESVGRTFRGAWEGCSSLTSFPAISLPQCVRVEDTWKNCTSLADFPAGVFDNTKATNYSKAFNNCALTETSVDNILVSVAQSVANDPSLTDGTLDIDGGTSAAPSATGEAAIDDLRAAGWTVNVNGGY